MLVRLLIIVALCLLPTACAAPYQPHPCTRTEGADTYSVSVIAKYADGRSDLVPLFLVCTPQNTLAIVDSNGDSYVSLDDFRDNNRLFTTQDEISVQKGFPTLDRPENIEWVTVSGHTTSTAWVWWLVFGVVAAAVVVAGTFWWRARRRATDHGRPEALPDEPAPGPQDDNSHEPTPQDDDGSPEPDPQDDSSREAHPQEDGSPEATPQNESSHDADSRDPGLPDPTPPETRHPRRE